MTLRPTPRGQGERGAVLVIVVLLLVAMVTMVALVIDYGFVRDTRQVSKSDADAAVASGILSLAPSGRSYPWQGVCSAIDYLEANDDHGPLTITYEDGDGPISAPCSDASRLTTECNPADTAAGRPTWARAFVSDGADFSAEIRVPYVTPDPSFPEDSNVYAGDDGKAAFGGCDQIAVLLFDSDDAFFGGIAGASDYSSAIRSVARADIDLGNEGTPAFLILERRKCQALVNRAAASNLPDGRVPAGIVVQAPSATEPAGIHVDSAATDGCGGSGPPGFAVHSGTVGSSPKRAGIIIESTPSTPPIPGVLSSYALAGGNAARAVATADGVSPGGTPGGVVSRVPVDTKYNPDSNPTIEDLHEAAAPLANASTLADLPAGYAEVTTCSGHLGHVATHVFVNCPGGYEPGAATFANATHIVFNGHVHIPSGSTLFMPKARRIIVGGTSSGGLSVAGGSPGGLLGTNANAFTADDSVKTACNSLARTRPPTELVIFGGRSSGSTEGALNVTGRAALCHTFVYLAGPKSLTTHDPQQVVNGSYDATCTPTTPCPTNGTNNAPDAKLIVGGFLKWTAPNTTDTPTVSGSAGVEDLALWTESESTSNVGTGGILDGTGVYFLPNAAFETRSPSEFNPTDAQFIARRLELLQGLMFMKPTANNSVQVPFLIGVSLVR